MKGKLLNLEFVRGTAALIVVCGHLKKYVPYLARHDNHYIQLFTSWGTECVMLFFILSGIVIHYSFEKRPKSSLTFLKQRVIRLHPTLLIALALSLFVEYYCFNSIPTVNTIIGNFIPYSTMQGHLALLLWNSNPVIWSLTFELFFFLVFALLIIRKKHLNFKGMNLWVIISLFSMVFFYNQTTFPLINHIITLLSLSFVWLTGFYIYKFRDIIYTDITLALCSVGVLPIVARLHIFPDYYDPVKYALFSLTAIPFLLLLLNGKKTENQTVISKRIVSIFLISIYLFGVFSIATDSKYPIVSKILYSALPIVMLILCKIPWLIKYVKDITCNYIIPFFAFFGEYSYAIYLIHVPIIIFVVSVTPFNLYVQISIILSIIFGISSLIDDYIQPYIYKKLS